MWSLNMQCEVTVGAFKFIVDEKTEKEVFEKISVIQEVFGQEKCGLCESRNIKYVVREAEDNKFFEVQCQEFSCRAKMAFGQHKKGNTLFPRRKDGDGNYIPNNGWEKWDGKPKPTAVKNK
jgi:hypothetical protein